MTSAQHAEGRQFNPGRVYATSTASLAVAGPRHACFKAMRHCHAFYHRLMLLSRGPSARRDQRQRATGAMSGTACGPHRAHGSPDSTPCHAQSGGWGAQAHNCVAQHAPEHTRAACNCVVHSAPSLELSHVYMAADTEGAMSTRGLVAMTSAQHAEGRQFDPGRV